MPQTTNDQPLRIIPLGGVGEIGKNMYVFEYRDEIVVIDCGLMFPDEEMFGIDLVIPDITYLKERRANVKAFLITHAHEDHVGALPYVLPEFPGVPVYASTLARGLLGNKIKEHKLHNNPLIALEPGDEIDIGAFHVIPFRVGHSIPDAMGIALRTPVGTIVHTGDFKFDHTPVDGKLSDFAILARLGQEGVALPPVRLDARREPGLHAVRADGRRGVPRDHGAARRPGHRGHLRQQHRPRPAGPRRGRGHEPQRVGHRPLDGAELPDRDRPRLPDLRPVADRAQGQDQGPPGPASSSSPRPAPRASRWPASPGWPTATTASSRSSRATRSSSAPARSRATRSTVSRTIDNLFKAGANVYYHTIKRAHVSGHASQEELKLMLGLTKPKHFIPMHGEFRMQVQHGRLAIETGVAPENVFIIENGTPIEFYADGTRPARQPGHGRLRLRRRPVGRRRRRHRPARPARAGQRRHVHDRRDRRQADRLGHRPAGDHHPRLRPPQRAATRSWRRRSSGSSQSIDTPGDHISEIALLKTQIKDGVSRYLYEQTKRRPMVFPVVVEV